MNMQTIRYELDDAGIATITFDEPGSKVNTMTQQWQNELAEVADRLERDRDRIVGVLLESAKTTFFAGAELNGVLKLRPADAAEGFHRLEAMKRSFRRIERLGRPVVALLNGAALGGGWEVALAAHARLALDDGQIRFGTPEVSLGLIPGATGITKTVRLLGLLAAQPYLLEGQLFGPREALELGLVHGLGDSIENLRAQALAWIADHPDATQPWDRKDYKMPGGTPASPKIAASLVVAPAMLAQKTRGLYPAAHAILEAMVEGAMVDYDTATRIESRKLAKTMVGQTTKNMVTAFFFNMNAIKSGKSRPSGVPPWKPTKVGVLGAGMMGAGIAHAAASRGIACVLKDLSVARARAGGEAVRGITAPLVARGRMTEVQQAQLLNRIAPTAEAADLRGCDLIIEAVFEQRDLKAAVTREAEPMLAIGGVFALIDESQARDRRRRIGEEADFYGAMDGASKFVKGDAIAGIVIIIVNILGGLAIGVLQQGVAPSEALRIYALLTVGDGLVSQLPALLISTATGIMVTRAAGAHDLGSQMFTQFTSQSRPLFVAGAMLALFGLMPGLPKLPFLAVAGVTLGAAYLIRRQHAEEAADAARPAPIENRESEQLGPQQVIQMMSVDPLEVEVGYGLIPIVDEASGGGLLKRITMIRRQVAMDLGLVLPTVRVRDNLQHPPNTYVVKLRGVESARGALQPGHFLAMDPGTAEGEVPGTDTQEPAFGMPARWIAPGHKERAELLGYSVVDAEVVLATHLKELVKRFAPDLLSRQDTQNLLEHLRGEYPALVEELVPTTLTIGEVQEVLQNLLAERVSIRDLVSICEALSMQARVTRDIDLLTEYARAALARQISRQYSDDTNTIRVITVGPRTEDEMAAAIQHSDRGNTIVLAPWQLQRLIGVINAEVERVVGAGRDPVILCSSRIRLALRRLLERRLPNVVLLSFVEVTAQTTVEAVGNIEVNVGNETVHRQ